MADKTFEQALGELETLVKELENGDVSLTSEMNETNITLLRKDLTEAEVNVEYIIREIRSVDAELKKFLFSLGCYEGETVTLISVLSENFVISVKDARYSIDSKCHQKSSISSQGKAEKAVAAPIKQKPEAEGPFFGY